MPCCESYHKPFLEREKPYAKQFPDIQASDVVKPQTAATNSLLHIII